MLGCEIQLGKKESEKGRTHGVSKGSRLVLKVDVFMCPPTSTSVEGVDSVPALADMDMTIL